jgi:hypothetical protein
MCLTLRPDRYEKKRDFIDKIVIEKTYGVAYKVGYKILDRTSHRLTAPIQKNGHFLKLNRWIHRNETSTDNSGERLWYDLAETSYESGYHIYIDKDEAKKMLTSYYKIRCGSPTVRKVYFKEVTAYGYERRALSCYGDAVSKIVVARQMFIPSLRNPKP